MQVRDGGGGRARVGGWIGEGQTRHGLNERHLGSLSWHRTLGTVTRRERERERGRGLLMGD